MATAWAPPLVVEPPAQEGSADAAPHGETVAHSGAAERDSAGINSPRGGVTSRGSGLLALAAEDAQHGAGSSGAGLVSSPARSSGRTSAGAPAALADGSAGLPRDGVLRDYHPDAPRAMRSLSNMHRVLTQLADPAARCEDARVVLGAAAQPRSPQPCCASATG